MLPALARRVSTHPKQALAVVAIVTVVMGVCARDVRLDNDFAALFSSDSSDARFRSEYRATFGADDGLLVAVLDADEPSERMYRTVVDAAEAVAAIPEVTHVDSVATLDVVGPAGIGPAFGPGTEGVPLADRIESAASSRLGSSHVISPDGRTTLVVGNLATEYDSYERVVGPAEDFRRVVDEVVAAAGHPVRVHYAGVAFTRLAAISEMQGDLLKLFPLATAMMAALLWWFFRRAVAVVAPMVAIVASVVGTAGVIGLAGDDINQITIIYPVLLMGVVVATATHLIHRFYRERAAGADAPTAARITLERVSRAAVVCTVTNAVGFVSLVAADLSILHEFGLYLAAGVGFCLLATSLAIPAMLVLADSEPPARYFGAPSGAERTRRFATAVTAPRTALVTTVLGLVLVGVSVLVATTARYDYSLSGMLNADRPTSVGNGLVDRRLSGIVPIEISVKGAARTFEDPANVERLGRLDDWLRRTEQVDAVGLPAVAAVAGTGELTALRDMAGDGLRRLVTDDASHTRLRGFHRDTGSTDIVALAERIDAEGARIFAGTGIEVRTTGEAPVAYAGMNELTRELVTATIIAIGLIVLAIGVAFRSVTLALVATLPNVAPVALGLAVYALTREVLDPVAGVVFCVAMGLAADDTVHLLNRYRELRPTTASPRDALVEALVTVRRAMVSSSAVLVASFLALGVSGFPTNRTLGLLGSLVLVLALGSDLVLGTAGLALAGRHADGPRAGDGRAGDGRAGDRRAGDRPH